MTITAPVLDPSGSTTPDLPKAAMLHGWRRTWFRFRQRKTALVAFLFLATMLFIAVFAPIMAPKDPAELNLPDRNMGFSKAYWFGTDDLGRDLTSRLMYGLRTSLLAAFVAVCIAVAIGLVVGILAGYVGRWVDAVLMRLTDGVIAIPSLLMTMAIIGVLGPGLRPVIIGLGVAFSPTFARLFRAQVLAVKAEQYVEAAVVAGANDVRIIRRHILPNSLAPIIVQALMAMGLALLAEGALSFLGLSVRPPGSSLGAILQRGFSFKERTQHPIIIAGIVITSLSWAFNIVADGLRDAIGRGEVGAGT
ncbi:MAG TPA: ABC transporter permease [Acidimicrobiales bacterium]|nr:ABC transporter permease [Acidimicrobiales bacterium]